MSAKTTTAALVPAERLNELAERCRSAVALAQGKAAEALTIALAVQELREAVLPLVPRIRPLIGTRLGFRTDRDNTDKLPPYPDAVVADALIEAIARGLRWTGNEFNIMGGNCYPTKEGYTRLVGELPGLTDLELTPAVPVMKENGAIVKYRAAWRQHGAPMSIERDVAVRLYSGQGVDVALGKATRKILAAVHGRVTGSTWSQADADAEDVDTPPKDAKEAKAQMLADKANRGLPPRPAAAEPAPAAGRQPERAGLIPGVDEDEQTGMDAIKG